MSATEDLNKNVQQAAEDAAKAAQQAYDAYKHLINVKAVATNGQLGALSAADTLSGAPVGDAEQVRKNIGLANVAATGSFHDLVGAPRLSLPDFQYSGNADFESKSVSVVDGFDDGAYPAKFWGMPTAYYTLAQFTASKKEHSIALVSANAGGHHFFISSRDDSNGGNFQEWSRILHSHNTTIDGNGFIKGASPILRIGNREDTITSRDFSPAGYGATNSEADGAVCERITEGVYRVNGAHGFADDGSWTIETPKDENGQALLWVNTKQEAAGTIIVETYHRTHPDAPAFARNTVAGKSDGDVIDIPAGRWIDLRLKMPEKER